MRVGMFQRGRRHCRSLQIAPGIGIRWWTRRRGHVEQDLPKYHRRVFLEAGGHGLGQAQTRRMNLELTTMESFGQGQLDELGVVGPMSYEGRTKSGI